MRGQKARGGGGEAGEEVLWEILDTGARACTLLPELQLDSEDTGRKESVGLR